MFYYSIEIYNPLTERHEVKGIVEGATYKEALTNLELDYGEDNIYAITHLEEFDTEGDGKALEVGELTTLLRKHDIYIQDNTNRPKYNDGF